MDRRSNEIAYPHVGNPASTDEDGQSAAAQRSAMIDATRRVVPDREGVLAVTIQPEESAAPKSADLLRSGSSTVVLNGLGLAVTLLTGVLIARLLHANGRGELTAVLIAPQLLGWVFAMGCSQATAYHQARHPGDAASLFGTWLVLLVPLSLIALAVGEVVLPWMLAAQSPHVLMLARLFMLTVIANMFGEAIFGMLLGDHEFLFYNSIRLAQPIVTVVAYLALWRLGEFNLTSVLLTIGIVILLVNLAGAVRAVRRFGVGAPSAPLARTSLWYGVRSHGTRISDIVTLRLDLAMLPAFVLPAGLGLYAIATTVSGVITTIAEALAALVLPVAARRAGRGPDAVVAMVQATFLVALTLAVLIAGIAQPGVRLVYGDDFVGAVPMIWLLLPGTVLYAVAAIFRQALNALNRPFTAAMVFAVGSLVTIPSLLFLCHVSA
jgi:O-antigen/teichoic acid export membrane protein